MADGFSPGGACPIPLSDYPRVSLAHGGGGRLMQQLIRRMLAPAFAGSVAEAQHDGARLPPLIGTPVMTTDSYVIRPRFFPGGDIGSLAVQGTVNDLAMCGAQPLYLTLGLILEEGLPMDELWRIVQSIHGAATAAGVQIVSGDTKVVEQGQADGIYINTAGMGAVPEGLRVHPDRVAPGDRILVSGDIGRHGIAVLSQREQLGFETTLASDCAALHTLVQALLTAAPDTHCLRDCTRGGLGAALIEIGEAAAMELHVEEGGVPVSPPVSAACELLGLEPLFVACEGRLVAFVPEVQAEAALAALRAHPLGEGATAIGHVAPPTAHGARVVMHSPYGTSRLLDLPSGEQLPRIC